MRTTSLAVNLITGQAGPAAGAALAPERAQAPRKATKSARVTAMMSWRLSGALRSGTEPPGVVRVSSLGEMPRDSTRWELQESLNSGGSQALTRILDSHSRYYSLHL